MRKRSIARACSLCLGVLTLLAAALLAWQAIDIYLDGTSAANLGPDGVLLEPVYSRELVAERLNRIAVPLWLWLAAAVAALGLKGALPEEKRRGGMEPEALARKLRCRAAGVAEEGECAQAWQVVRREERSRRIAWTICAAVCTICAAISAVYLLDVRHFTSWELEQVMGDMLRAVVPWAALAFASVFAASVYARRSTLRALPELKKLSAKGQKPSAKAARGRGVPAARIALGAAAVALIALGVSNGGMRDVLVKAINICTECIGLG